MEPHELALAAKYVGAGLAAIGTGSAGIGLGTLFGQFLNRALRNPSAVDGQFGRLIFGFAVTEELGIFALLISFLLLFAVSGAKGISIRGKASCNGAFPAFLPKDPRWLSPKQRKRKLATRGEANRPSRPSIRARFRRSWSGSSSRSGSSTGTCRPERCRRSGK